MTYLSKSQSEIFEVIKSELSPLSIYDILLQVGYQKKTVGNCLAVLQKKKLVFSFHRWGMTYYLEGNPEY
ncbi:MAG: hypothetical protein AAGJ08_25115 [Cyanobacteria bacterium P01_H01_bin.35]